MQQRRMLINRGTGEQELSNDLSGLLFYMYLGT